MQDIFENGNLKTCNTPLAAYLKSEGFRLTDIDYTDQQHITFIFADDCGDLQDKRRAWLSCQAVGNIPVWYDIYKELVGKIKTQTV